MPEEIKEILTKLKDAVAILVLSILVVVFFVTNKIVPTVQNIMEMNDQYAAQTLVLADKQRELDQLKAEAKKQEDMSGIEKTFFQSDEVGLDAEGLIAGEFEEILKIIRANTIKMLAINYTYDPKDDKFVQGVPGKYSVALLDMELISNYKNFETFLKALYQHEHFLDISKVEVEPYEKNKSILMIKFALKLYAKN